MALLAEGCIISMLISAFTGRSSKGRLLILRIESKGATGKNKVVPGKGMLSPIGMGESSSVGTSQPIVLGDSISDEVGGEEHRIAGSEGWELSLISQTNMQGMVLSVCPYLEQYILAGVGNNVRCSLSLTIRNIFRTCASTGSL